VLDEENEKKMGIQIREFNTRLEEGAEDDES
jgi:hypothetical protein